MYTSLPHVEMCSDMYFQADRQVQIRPGVRKDPHISVLYTLLSLWGGGGGIADHQSLHRWHHWHELLLCIQWRYESDITRFNQ